MSKMLFGVAESTRQIIESGIARRILCEGGQPHLPNDPADCLFWVEVETSADGREVVEVVVQYPPNMSCQGFDAIREKGFGGFEQPPLDDAQMALVERLADAYRSANSPTA